MTVGLALVSHSASLAAGVRELAGQMAPDVGIAVAGGTEDGGIGTSFELVTAALAEADTGDGVVVLYDLGSALLTTETALEFAEPDQLERIVVVDAPLVEGAVAAAVAAQAGSDVHAVAAAAVAAGGSWPAADSASAVRADQDAGSAATATATAIVADAVGIHARPASILAREMNSWPSATVTVGRPSEQPADVRNVLAVIGLGLRHQEQVELAGSGDGAADAVRKLAELINAGMD